MMWAAEWENPGHGPENQSFRGGEQLGRHEQAVRRPEPVGNAPRRQINVFRTIVGIVVLSIVAWAVVVSLW
jgi:hypothetical protein